MAKQAVKTVRIVSEGPGHSAHIYDAETGREIYCTAVSIEIRPGERSRATLAVAASALGLDADVGDKDWSLTCPVCRTVILGTAPESEEGT